MKRLILWLIGSYKTIISPYLGQKCRFHPSCSEYCKEAIERCGVLRGIVLGLCRILRCNPLFKGGIDYPFDYPPKL